MATIFNPFDTKLIRNTKCVFEKRSKFLIKSQNDVGSEINLECVTNVSNKTDLILQRINNLKCKDILLMLSDTYENNNKIKSYKCAPGKYSA